MLLVLLVNPIVIRVVAKSSGKPPTTPHLNTTLIDLINIYMYYRSSFYFAQVNYDSSGLIECESCRDIGEYGCADATMYVEALTIAEIGMGMGIPFIVIGAGFGLLWLVKAVVQPTKSGGGKTTPKA